MSDPVAQDLVIDTIVFDFDGTLAELRLDFAEMKQRLADLAGPRLGYRPRPGALPALEWLAVLAEEIPAGGDGSSTDLARAGQDLIRAMELDAARRGRLFPFTRALLRDLQGQGLATAIITRNCLTAVELVFPDWSRYCAVLLSRDQVPRVKPDPDHLLRAVAALGSAPRSSLMVGDHPLDIETGRRAATWTAGVASGNLSMTELAGAGPDWVAPDCAALIAGLNREGRLLAKADGRRRDLAS